MFLEEIWEVSTCFFCGRCFRDVRAGTAYSAGSVALTAADRPIDVHTDVVAKYDTVAPFVAKMSHGAP